MAKRQLVKSSDGEYGIYDPASKNVIPLPAGAQAVKSEDGEYGIFSNGKVTSLDSFNIAPVAPVEKKKPSQIEDMALSGETGSLASKPKKPEQEESLFNIKAFRDGFDELIRSNAFLPAAPFSKGALTSGVTRIASAASSILGGITEFVSNISAGKDMDIAPSPYRTIKEVNDKISNINKKPDPIQKKGQELADTLYEYGSAFNQIGSSLIRDSERSIGVKEENIDAGITDLLSRGEIKDALKKVGVQVVAQAPNTMLMAASGFTGAAALGTGLNLTEEFEKDRDVSLVDGIKSIGKGLVEGATEYIFRSDIDAVKSLGKSVVNLTMDEGKEAIKKLIKEEGKEAAKEAITRSLGAATIKGLKGAGEEGVEEVLSMAGSFIIDRIEDGKWDQQDYIQLLKQAGDAFIVGAASSGLITGGVASASIQRLTDVQKKEIERLSEVVNNDALNQEVRDIAQKKIDGIIKFNTDKSISNYETLKALPMDDRLQAMKYLYNIESLQDSKPEARELSGEIDNSIKQYEDKINEIIEKYEGSKLEEARQLVEGIRTEQDTAQINSFLETIDQESGQPLSSIQSQLETINQKIENQEQLTEDEILLAGSSIQKITSLVKESGLSERQQKLVSLPLLNTLDSITEIKESGAQEGVEQGQEPTAPKLKVQPRALDGQVINITDENNDTSTYTVRVDEKGNVTLKPKIRFSKTAEPDTRKPIVIKRKNLQATEQIKDDAGNVIGARLTDTESNISFEVNTPKAVKAVAPKVPAAQVPTVQQLDQLQAKIDESKKISESLPESIDDPADSSIQSVLDHFADVTNTPKYTGELSEESYGKWLEESGDLGKSVLAAIKTPKAAFDLITNQLVNQKAQEEKAAKKQQKKERRKKEEPKPESQLDENDSKLFDESGNVIYEADNLYDDPAGVLAYFAKMTNMDTAAKQKGLYAKTRDAIANNIITRALSRVSSRIMVSFKNVGDRSFMTYTTKDADGKDVTKEVSVNSIWKDIIGYGEGTIKKALIGSMNSSSLAGQEVQNALSALIPNLTATEAFQEQRRVKVGTVSNANILISKISKNLNAMINGDTSALVRVHSLLDPEAFEEYSGEEILPESIDDLSITERTLYNTLRALNDFMHEWHFRNGFINQETYDKFKGNYIARMYLQFEQEQFKDIYDAIDKTGAGADLRIFKARKDYKDISDMELADPIYITSKRLATMMHNMAVLDFSNEVASSKEYKIYDKESDIPKEVAKFYKKLKGFGTKRFGALTDKYVPVQIYEQLYGTTFVSQMMSGFYDKVLNTYDRLFIRQLVSKSKTVLSPLTRIGNITSGFSFALLGGVDPITLLKNKPAARKAIEDYSEYAQDLTKAGLLGSSLKQLGVGKIDEKSAGIKAIKKILGERAAEKVETFDEWASATYSNADDITKIAYYISLVEDMGIDKKEAIKMTAENMQNYNTVGKAFIAASKTPVIGNKFIRFKADSARILYNTIKNRPVYGAMFAAMMVGLTRAASYLSGESDEEREAREKRPYQPKLNLLFRDVSFGVLIGDTEYNISRYISPYSVYDKGYNGNTLTDLFEYMPVQLQYDRAGSYGPQYSDPLLGPVAQALFDKDFRGLKVSDPRAGKYVTSTLTEKQQAFNRIFHVFNSWGQPYTQWSSSIYNAMQEKPDAFDRRRDLHDALLSIVVKNEKLDKDILIEKYTKTLNAMDNEIKQISVNISAKNNSSDDKISKIKELYNNGEISKSAFEKQVKEIQDERDSFILGMENEIEDIVKQEEDPERIIKSLSKLKQKKK